MKAIFLIVCLWCSDVLADQHWAVGGWDCRSWGAIRLFDDGLMIDVDPDGFLTNWGYWQIFDQNSVILMWMDSSKMEIITKDGDKFYTQSSHGFGISSEIEETKKTLIEKEHK